MIIVGAIDWDSKTYFNCAITVDSFLNKFFCKTFQPSALNLTSDGETYTATICNFLAEF